MELRVILNSIEHCSLGLLSSFLEGVPTSSLREHGSNAACPGIVSLYKAGRTFLDHLKLLDVGICIWVPDP